MAYEKSGWQQSFDILYTSTAALDYTRAQLWHLKALLMGQVGGMTGTGLWTCHQSCDGAGNFGTPGDAVDRWGGAVYTPANIIRGNGAVAHSWFVLKSPVGLMAGNTWYLIISFDGTADANCTFTFTKVPPTGGSNTVTPTSAGMTWGLGINATQASINAGAAVAGMRPNMVLATDGSFYYFPVQIGQAVPSLLIAVVAPVSYLASDPYPIWTYKSYSVSGAGGTLQTALAGGTGACMTFTSGATAGFSAIMSMGAVNDTQLSDSITGLTWSMPAWLNAVTATTYWHTRGRIPDLLCLPGSTNYPPLGTVFRNNAGAIEYVSIGTIAIPASSVPVLR